MSNYGQAALSIVGFAVGSFFGYPQLGFVLGSLAGSALFPTQLPGVQGPRLTDTRTTNATVGAPIMEVFGTDGVPGNVIWTGETEEVATKEEVGGKGGPEQDVTTYTYFQTLAVGICRGPMGGIRQIFENGKLAYDLSPQRADETQNAYLKRVQENNAYASQFVLYLGDEEQLPDPTLEAELGLGEVPAFRGLMYIVFPRRELKQEQGLRHPNFKFVVFDEGALDCGPLTLYHTGVVFPWVASYDPRSCLNDHTYQSWDGGHPFRTSLNAAIADSEAARGRPLQAVMQIGWSPVQHGVIAPHIVPFSAWPLSGARYVLFNDFNATTYLGLPPPNGGAGNGYYLGCATMAANGISIGQIVWTSGRNQDYPNPAAENKNYAGSGLSMPVLDMGGGATNPPAPFGWGTSANGCQPYGFDEVRSSGDAHIQIARIPRKPDHPCFPRCGDPSPDYGSNTNYCVFNGFVFSKDGDWQPEDQGRDYRSLRIAFGGNTQGYDGAIYHVGPTRVSGQDEYNDQAFWEAAYEEAVAAGQMPPGMTYGPTLDQTSGTYPTQTGGGAPNKWYLELTACEVSTLGVSIARIIRTICLRTGLTEAQIDVSDLEDKYVSGYTLTRQMSARDAILPLRLVGYFDIIESERELAFPIRGKAPVLTIDEEELAAHEFGADIPASVNTRKLLDKDLPRRIRLHYRDPGRDYEEGMQSSPSRLNTPSVNDIDIECPVAISADLALRSAEVQWQEAWASRWIEQFALGSSSLPVQPGDCVLLPVDNRLERVRVIAVDGPVSLRRFEGVRDDADGYVSTVIADPPVRPPQILVVYSPTTLLLLDLPALRDEDNDGGIYAAAQPADGDGTWSGARIYHSADGGGVFENEGAVTNVATIGVLGAELPAGDPWTWDNDHELLVTLSSGSFESRTDDDVLSGANAVAVRRGGAWEIVQFTTAEQTGAATWRLTNLLRGRRGTEWTMDTPAYAGAAVVLVSGPGIIRLPMLNTELNTPQIYKAITIGTSYSTGVDQSFTPTGVALEPFSPVHIERTDNAGDIVLTWIRRDRLGQELQSGTQLPMSEATLAFEVDIYDVSMENVVRTISVTDTTATYTAAQQVTDFGGAAPDPMRVAIYQLSAVVGRGTPGEAIV